MLEASGLPRPCSGMRIIENPWDILGPLGPGPWRPWSKSQRLICSVTESLSITEPSPDSGSLHWPSWQQEGRLTPCGRVGRFDCRPANIEKHRWPLNFGVDDPICKHIEVGSPEIISQPFKFKKFKQKISRIQISDIMICSRAEQSLKFPQDLQRTSLLPHQVQQGFRAHLAGASCLVELLGKTLGTLDRNMK